MTGRGGTIARVTDHLNLFEPYERKAASHEDALTRAFLLVLRGVPVAHAAWLHLVDAAHRANGGGGVPGLHAMPAPQVRMQTARVPAGTRRVISLVQTDEQVFRDVDAAPSERRQVLDGVVSYGELAVVIENKPHHRNIWEGQLDVNVPEGVEHDPRVASTAWKDIVSAWGRLLEAGHLSVAEAVIVSDFLDYVEEHFPRLRPYSRVGLCGADAWRLTRRCRAILEAIASSPDHVGYHRGWGTFIDLPDGLCARKIGLMPKRRGGEMALVLEIVPGDTMGQARRMYRSVELARLLRLLQEERWSAAPNFHLMFMTTDFFYPGARQSVSDYWSAWASHPKLIRQWKRASFAEAFEALVRLGVVEEGARPMFDKDTAQTKRSNVNFAPGIAVPWTLPLDEAAALDEVDQLEDAVAEAVRRAVETLQLRSP